MSFLESLKASLSNVFQATVNTKNKLFVVIDPAGNEIVLTLDELLVYPIPPGSSITLLVPEADVKPNAKPKLFKVGDKLVIQEGDLELELEGLSVDVSTLQILDPAAMTAETQANIAAAINKKGFDAAMYELLSDQSAIVPDVSANQFNPAVLAVGGLAVAVGGGGGGAGGGAGADTTAPTLQSVTASTRNDTITLTFDEALDTVNVPTAADFTVNITPNGGVAAPAVITSVSVVGATVVLGIGAGINALDSIEVIYADSDATDNNDEIQDAAGNDALGFTDNTAVLIAADGYMRGAQVWLDTDNDGDKDLNTGITTNADGSFALPSEYLNNGGIVIVGGFNIDTGVKNTMELKAPEGALVINPLTTLVQGLVEQGQDADAAETNVANVLGIAGTDLSNYDPLAAADANVQKVAAQIATVASLAGESGGETVVANLVSQISDAAEFEVGADDVINLSDDTALAGLFTGVEVEASTFVEISNAAKVIDEVVSNGGDIGDISDQQGLALDSTPPSTPEFADNDSVNPTAAAGTTAIRVVLDVDSTEGAAVVSGNTVALKVDGQIVTLQTSLISSGDIDNGYIDLELTGDFADGSHSISAQITDKAGNASAWSTAVDVVFDTTAPNKGLISDVENAIVNDAAQSISGFAEPQASVKIYNNIADVNSIQDSELVTTVTADADGNWSADVELGEGDNVLQIVVVDAAGNTSLLSLSETITLDTSEVTKTATLVSASNSDGEITAVDDVFTSDKNIVELAGAISGALAAGEKVAIFEADNFLGYATVVDTDWTFTPLGLSDADHSFIAKVVNAAGTEGASSDAFALTVDANAPTHVITIEDIPLGNVSPTISASVDKALADGESIQVYLDGVAVDATIVFDGTDFTFTLDVDPGEGEYTVQAMVVDAANQGPLSTASSFEIDTSAPATATVTPIGANGNVNAAMAEAGVVLSGFAEAGASVEIAALSMSGTVSASGAWSFDLSSDDLTALDNSDGTATVVVTVTDAAGNPNDTDLTYTFNLDVTPPADPAFTSDFSFSKSDNDGTSALITLTADTGSRVLLTLGDKLVTLVEHDADDSPGEFQYVLTTGDFKALGQGDTTISAQAVDAAGNESDGSDEATVSIDTIPPVLTLFTMSVPDKTGTFLNATDTLDLTFTTEASVDVQVRIYTVTDGVVDIDDGPILTTLDGTPAFVTSPGDGDAEAGVLAPRTIEDILSNYNLADDGAYSIQLTATDGANSTTIKGKFTLDATAPSSPIGLSFEEDLGVASDDNLTADNTLELSVLALKADKASIYFHQYDAESGSYSLLPGKASIVYKNGTALLFDENGDEAEDGTYYKYSKQLEVYEDGSYQFAASAEDRAGNEVIANLSIPLTSSDAIVVTAAASEQGGNAYFINGEESPAIVLAEGVTYTFDVSDTSLATHPFKFSLTDDGTHNAGSEFTSGVVASGTIGTEGATISVTVPVNTGALYYYCSAHAGMGSSIETPENLQVTIDTSKPEFASDEATADAINENTGASAAIFTAEATDASAITYTLKNLDDDDHALFTINGDTGVVTLTENADSEVTANADAEDRGYYTFTVVATDVAGNVSEQLVKLPVNDLDETDPVFEAGTADAIEIIENSGAGQVVFTASAADTADVNDDTDTSSSLSYSLKADNSDNADLFEIDAETGEVTLTVDPDSEATTADGGDGAYHFTVVATDEAGNSDEQAVSLAITDLDESAPEFSAESATATAIDENSGAGLVIYDASSVVLDTADVDDPTDTSDALVYSLKTDNEDDAEAFTIDAATGVVTLVANPNYEEAFGGQAGYTFTVIATDAAGNADEQVVTLGINDVNDQPSKVGEISQVQTAVLSKEFSGDYSGYFEDQDGDVLTYAIDAGDADLSTYGLSFDTDTGILSATEVTGDKTTENITVTITASDSALTQTQSFDLRVVAAPEIVSFEITTEDDQSLGKAGETLTAVVTLSEPFEYVAGTAAPTLEFVFDDQTATATYASHTTGDVDSSVPGTLTFTMEAPSADATSVSLGNITMNGVDITGLISDQPFDETVLSATSDTFELDSTAPEAPDAALVADTGGAGDDAVTDSLALTDITNNEDTATVEYRINEGDWSETYTAPTTDGDYLIEVRQTDAAGNVSATTTIDATLDSTDPSVPTDQVAAYENASAIGTFTITDSTAVSVALAAYDETDDLDINDVVALVDNGNNTFTLTWNADALTADGTLGDNGGFDFESIPAELRVVNHVTVVATDAAGNESTVEIPVMVTNKNEAPTVVTDAIPEEIIFVVGREDSFDLDDYFTDQDEGDSLSYTGGGETGALLLSGDFEGVTYNEETHVITGTISELYEGSITVTATDSEGQTATTEIIPLRVIEGPSLSTSIEGRDDIDPTKALRVVSTEALNWGADGVHTITITNQANSDTKDGFAFVVDGSTKVDQGEATDNTQQIVVTVASGAITHINDVAVDESYTGPMVSLSENGKIITIEPEYDLDFENNYSLSISESAFVGQSSNVAIDAFSVDFATVTVGTDTDLTNDDLSQYVSADGILTDGSYFVNGSQGKYGSSVQIKELDVSSDAVTLVLSVDDTGSIPDGFMYLDGFGTNDAIYWDNMGDNTLESFGINQAAQKANQLTLWRDASGQEREFDADDQSLTVQHTSAGPVGSGSKIVLGGISYAPVLDAYSEAENTFLEG